MDHRGTQLAEPEQGESPLAVVIEHAQIVSLVQIAQHRPKVATITFFGEVQQGAARSCRWDITTYHSTAKLNELRNAVDRIVNQRVAQTPTLTVLGRTRKLSEKVSEKKKGYREGG